MTVAIADVRGTPRIASDSLVTYGHTRATLADGKILVRGRWALAVSGAAGGFRYAAQALDNLESANAATPASIAAAIRALAKADHQTLDGGNAGWTAMLVDGAKRAIYHLGCDGSAFRVDDLSAIGGGDEAALGAMHAFAHRADDGRTALEQSVEIACKLNAGCGPPVHLWEWDAGVDRWVRHAP